VHPITEIKQTENENDDEDENDRIGILAEVMDLAHSVNWRGEAFHSGLYLQR
jgi:hypothetical protein